MCFSDSTKVNIVCAGEPAEALMNQNVVNQEIANTITQNTYANKESKVEPRFSTKKNEQ
jgi:hypothetical protein